MVDGRLSERLAAAHIIPEGELLGISGNMGS
jgi:hypothetical protein